MVTAQKTVTVDFFTHKSVKNSVHEPQYFIEGHHEPIIPKDDWLRVQQILREKRYSRHRSGRQRKPKYVVKGALAGFMIADTGWETEFVDSILEKLSDTTTPPQIVEDENFTIEKE